MKIDEQFIDRLSTLIKFGEEILNRVNKSELHAWVNGQSAFQFGITSLNILSQICGKDSVQFRNFESGFDDLKKDGLLPEL